MKGTACLSENRPLKRLNKTCLPDKVILTVLKMWTSDTDLMQHGITALGSVNKDISLFSTLQDTCMGKNYLVYCLEHNKLHWNQQLITLWVRQQASLCLLYGSNPPPPFRQRFQRVMTVRYNYQGRKQEQEKRHSARLITKEPVNWIMLASLYLNCCDLQCNDMFKGLKYIFCKTPNFYWRCSVPFPSSCFLKEQLLFIN